MKILILYETYSGGTHAASEYVAAVLGEMGHSVELLQAHVAGIEKIRSFDLVVFATPSWLEDKKEGQPHVNYVLFMNKMIDVNFNNVKFAAFGLGDKSYAHFCMAVDIVSGFVSDRGGISVAPLLKIDSYLIEVEKGKEAIKNWVEVLLGNLNSVKK